MGNLSMAEVVDRGMARREMPAVCPFCGDDPPLAAVGYSFGRSPRYMVGCQNDDCPAQPSVSGDTIDEAWARWNRRAP
jgi:hypothetical protein